MRKSCSRSRSVPPRRAHGGRVNPSRFMQSMFGDYFYGRFRTLFSRMDRRALPFGRRRSRFICISELLISFAHPASSRRATRQAAARGSAGGGAPRPRDRRRAVTSGGRPASRSLRLHKARDGTWLSRGSDCGRD